MRAYSQDLREHVLRAVDQGATRQEIVRLFGISLATLKRYLKQRNETGSLSPKGHPGRPPKKFAPLQAGLVAQLEEHPDVTLETHCHHGPEQYAVAVSTSTMSRAIKRVGWTRKKRRWVPLSATQKHEPAGKTNSNVWTRSNASSSMSVAPISV